MLISCIWLVSVFFISTPPQVSADQEGDYTFTVSGGVAIITDYTGTGGVITIPSTLGGYPTAHIGDDAFYENLAIVSVTIPDSVVTIGNSSFDSCSNLISISIPTSVTSIGIYAFISCSSLTSVMIPNSVTSIGEGAFASCSNMFSISIPMSVISIGDGAFAYCSNLTEIMVDAMNTQYASINGVLYNKLKTIVLECPAGKTGSISLPSSVTIIGNGAFLACTQLTSVLIPNSVNTIGYNAFSSCSALSSVSIGSGVTSIGKNAFFSCTSLSSIVLPGSVKTIGDFAFSYCPLTSIMIPNSVTTIGFYAFSYCPLTTVIMGSGVTTIGNFAFLSCTSLSSITFLGLVAPTNVGMNWILSTPGELRGHAYPASNFPVPGASWNGLVMGAYVSINTPPVVGAPSPGNGSQVSTLNFSWSISINDVEDDSFAWMIQCSNGQSSNATDASNGIKILGLSGLTMVTTYTVWVNATDPAGSGLYTRRWFFFTTAGEGSSGSSPSVNEAPVADASAGEPYQGLVNTSVVFDGSRSSDSDGTIVEWLWFFGDNTSDSGRIVNHSFAYPATFTVSLTVVDDEGATSTDIISCLITSNNTPPLVPVVTGPTNGTRNVVYTYSFLAFDADNDTLEYRVDWGDEVSSIERSGFLPAGVGFSVNHSWVSAGRYLVGVTVDDNESESLYSFFVFIDAVPCDGVGYLVDDDADGHYDSFHSDVMELRTVVQRIDDEYLIDSDDDGVPNYRYTSGTGLVLYQPASDSETSGFLFVFFVGAMLLVFLLWKKNINE